MILSIGYSVLFMLLHNINNAKVAPVIIFLTVGTDRPGKTGEDCNLLKHRPLLTILSIDHASTLYAS